MKKAVPLADAQDAANDIAAELIGLLHQGAAADEFAGRLAALDRLADDTPGKSSQVELVRMAMGVRNRLELQQQRERGMLAVIESAQDLSGRLDLNGLLQAIVSRARHLLGSQVAWLSTYDSEKDEFHVMVADGALSKGPAGMVARRDLGVASIVMSTRLPFTTPDYLHDKRFPHDAKLDATFRDEGIAALVGAPLIWDNEVIGLLFVADRYHRAHTALNVSILCTLAIHGAVALKNARAFEQARAALHKAEVARLALERHSRNVQAAAEAHEQMTSLLARGASLSTLCQTIAELLGGAVLVLDEASQVLSRGTANGYSGPGAPAYSPFGHQHSAQLAQALRESRQVGRSVLAFEADGELCRLMAVIGGDDVLGSVLLFRGQDLDEISTRTFERSASVIGIVLLSQERMEAARSRSGSTLLRSIVSARQDEAALLANRAERLGLDLAKPLSLLLLEMDEIKPSYAARRLGLGTTVQQVLFDEIDGLLAILCGTTRAEDLRDSIAAQAKAEFGGGFRGVLSRPVAGPAEVPALYATLKRALPILGRIGVGGHIVGQNDMALYSTLFETHDQSSLRGFLDATIGPLLSHDLKRGSELTATLLSYFDNNQNAKTTSQRLNIHVNTVRQRLASVEELLGYWGNATRALELHIALRLWSLTGQAAISPGR